MKFILCLFLIILNTISAQEIKNSQSFIEIDGFGNNGAVEELITYEIKGRNCSQLATALYR